MKKIIYGLGSLGAIIAPVATVVACGDDDDSPSIKFNLVDKPLGTMTSITSIDLGDSSNPADARALITPAITTSSGTASAVTSKYNSATTQISNDMAWAFTDEKVLELAEDLAQAVLDYTSASSTAEFTLELTYDGQTSTVTNTVDYSTLWEKFGVTYDGLSSLSTIDEVNDAMLGLNDPEIGALDVISHRTCE